MLCLCRLPEERKELFFDIREQKKGVFFISAAGYVRTPGCPTTTENETSLPDFPPDLP